MLPSMFEQALKTGAITEFTALDNVLADYDKVWKGYTRTKGKDGGWVDVAEKAKDAPEYGKNKAATDFLAATGRQIKLLPVHNKENWKNPDVLLEDGRLWEIETPDSATSSALDRAIREGQRQADYVILHLNKTVPEEMLRRSVWLRLTRKDSPSNLKALMIIEPDGVVRQYSADQIKKEWAQKKRES